MIIDCALLYDSDHRKRCMREELCESNIRVIIDKLLIVLILFFPFFLRDKVDSIFFVLVESLSTYERKMVLLGAPFLSTF
jgi:hypothetical protein